MITSKGLSKSILKQIESVEDIDAFVVDLIKTLEEKNLTHLLPGLLKKLSLVAKNEGEKGTLKITFSNEPKDSAIKHIEKFVGAKDSEKIISIDKDIIGGFIAEYGGTLYDGSVRNFTRKLKEELLQA